MITTGKAINDLLKAHAPLTALVGTKIYPIVVPENAVFPVVVYQRNFENQHTKDGLGNSKSTVTITVLSKDYTPSIDISTACHNALKAEAKLISGTEDYADGIFAQVLVFEYWSA